MDSSIKKTSYPLVIDLDGTLTTTDTLVESVVNFIKKSPLNIFKIPLWLLRGRAGFKSKIAENSTISGKTIPYRADLLNYLKEEKSKGRKIVLATAAHSKIAKTVTEDLGIFDLVLATENDINLKGKDKLKLIKEKVGDEFVYAGDSKADLPIWAEAKAAILVGVSDKVAQNVSQSIDIEREFYNPSAGIRTWLNAFRVHQWVKNFLLFVPILTAFAFNDSDKIINLILAFISFSLCASSTYIVNDIWDLENDRAHPRKRNRPFANGQISIIKGFLVSFFLLSISLLIASTISLSFLSILLVYLALTSSYSWVFKEYVLIDAIMLSILYTIRILAGSIAASVTTSSWLLAFSVFVFLSLALVKRCAELVSLGDMGKLATRGRDYRVSDLVVLWPLGVGAALSAVVVFGLFINSAETQKRYLTSELLWAVAILLIYWLSRLWIKTSRGEMHDDPVVYAIKDKGSRLTVFTMLIITIFAHSIFIDF